MSRDIPIISDAVLASTPDARPPMDEQAFLACYRRTAGPLRAYALRILGDAALADDIVQESYLRLLRMPAPPDEPEALRALLMRIASNLMADHWRKRKREIAKGREPAIEVGASGPDIPLRLDMRRIFNQLRPEQRQMMWLAYVEGADHREIASALGLGVRSVRVLLYRARRKLAGLLRESGVGRGDK